MSELLQLRFAFLNLITFLYLFLFEHHHHFCVACRGFICKCSEMKYFIFLNSKKLFCIVHLLN